jgi:hypothetical protein
MTYLLDFGDVDYRTLIGGFDNINYGMCNALLDKNTGLKGVSNNGKGNNAFLKEGGVYLGHKLVNINQNK